MHPRFRLDINQDTLKFTAGCPSPPSNPIALANAMQFTPELWKHDVGELFIKHTTNDAYLEINLSPHGAWWAALFSGYRSALSSVQELGTVHAKVTADSWETTITVPLSFLRETLDFGETSRANICFILGTKTRHHFSWAPLPHDPPDFHQVADFVPLEATPQ